MEKLSLQSIKDAVNGQCDYDCEIKNICIDTRKLKEDCLYIAIKGENFDGHTFIPQAFEKGAKAVISDHPIDGYEAVIVVKDTKQALLDLAGYYRGLFQAFTVGVTGSVGKTSTKEMIYTILNAGGKTLKNLGNFNNEIGMPMAMFNLNSSYKNAVFEMGMSDFGEIRALTKVCRPSVGVLTNIGVSHIETLKTQENILKAKLEIIEGMSQEAPLIVNADDVFLQKVDQMIENPIISFGIENTTADIIATDIKQEGLHTDFQIQFYGRSIKAQIPTIGRHNVRNALAAFCVGLVAEISPEQIVGAMKWYKNADMRQNITVINGITIIEDCYNASPDSMFAAIDVMNIADCGGKRICVLGDMLELGEFSEESHIEVGKAVARSKADMLLLYGEEAKNIKKGAIIIGMKNVVHFDEKEKLASYLYTNIQRGDVLLFKASRGIKMEEVIICLKEMWEKEQ